MTSVPTIPRPGRAWLVAPLGVVLALTVAACTSSGAASPTTTAPAAQATMGPRAGAQGQGLGGGVSGTIAFVSGALMQVQDSQKQTAVTWTTDTKITSEVAGTLADVTPGMCVLAVTRSADAATGSTTSATPTAAATSVTISDAVDGACSVGSFGGGLGGGGMTDGGFPTDLPTDLPGMPTGMPGGGSVPTGLPSGGAMPGGGGFGGFSAGLVTAVATGSITVQTTAQDGTTSSASIVVDGATTYNRTASADATALVVGACVLARGKADDAGKVAATSLAVSQPVDGSCTTRSGFGGMGGQGRPGAAAGTSGTAPRG